MISGGNTNNDFPENQLFKVHPLYTHLYNTHLSPVDRAVSELLSTFRWLGLGLGLVLGLAERSQNCQFQGYGYGYGET